VANGLESSLLTRLTNSLKSDHRLHVVKTWGGGLYSKDHPDLRVTNKVTQTSREVELKAYVRPKHLKFPLRLPITLTTGQKKSLEGMTRLDGGDAVGGLVVTEWVGEAENILVAQVPHLPSWREVPNERPCVVFSRGPIRIWGPEGLLIWMYEPVGMTGREFDLYRWVFTEPWWQPRNRNAFVNAIWM